MDEDQLEVAVASAAAEDLPPLPRGRRVLRRMRERRYQVHAAYVLAALLFGFALGMLMGFLTR